MANEIKQKIILDGEKEYNRALSEAKRNLKTLRSELKAETAELGANATAQQKNEVRIKSLQKQIKEQEKVVKTYEAALKEVKTKYADNEEAIAKWEVKLNDARTALANMRNDLQGVGESFKTVQGSADMAAVASKSVADTFGKLSEIGGAISDSIESVFTGLITTIRATMSEIWGMIADTAAKANNWTDLASYYGTTATEIERMNKAIEWSQGNFGDFTNLLNQLSWGGKGKKITEWFGISDVNYENKLDYAVAVLEKMKALSQEEPGKLGDAMEDIFGSKKSQQIMWFVSNLETIQDNLREYDEHGYGMGEDALQQMNDVWLELGEIEGKWEDLKQRFAAGLGTVTLNIMTNVNGALDALSDYFNAESDEDRDKALKKLEENILSMFETAKKAIEDGIALLDKVAEDLKASDNPTAKALGEVVSGLVTALQWLTEDNMKNVVSALEILAGFWLAGKGLQMAMKIASVVADLKTIQLLQGVGGLGSGGGGGVGTAGGGGLWTTVKAFLAKAFPVALGAGLVVNDSLNNHGDENTWTEEEIKEIAEKNDFDLWKNQKQNGNASVAMTPAQWQAVQDFWDEYRKHPMDFSDEAWDAFEGAFTGAEDAFDKINELMDYLVQAEHPNDWQDIEDLPSSWWTTQGGNAGNTDGLTSADARGMTDAVNKMPQAVQRGVSGMRVMLNGTIIGQIVAEEVSKQIAGSIE